MGEHGFPRMSLYNLGKVQPDLLIRTASAWLGRVARTSGPCRGCLPERRQARQCRHAPAARLGAKPHLSLEAVTLNPRRVRIGGRVVMTSR